MAGRDFLQIAERTRADRKYRDRSLQLLSKTFPGVPQIELVRCFMEHRYYLAPTMVQIFDECLFDSHFMPWSRTEWRKTAITPKIRTESLQREWAWANLHLSVFLPVLASQHSRSS